MSKHMYHNDAKPNSTKGLTYLFINTENKSYGARDS